ncbi:hypothetical protein HELRODRAFT_114133, partial [Helobdella robusta]|uniref:PHD-type domain-containing protein n=1 Tax=Helobdella robusta TaxID=6412 RepID=T1EFZ4_HELRO
MDYHRHPVLKVLICRKCYYWYTSAEVDQDSEGTDEQCRWCRQGGDLICCDFCHNSFCKGCIRRNLGRKELNSILDSDECSKWKCYVCNPKPLLSLIEHCSAVMEALTKLEKKQQELELKRTKRYHIKSSTVASSTGNTSFTLPSANSAAMVCNGSVSGVADKSQTRSGSSRVVVNNNTSAATTTSNSSRLSAGSNGYFGIMPNSTLQVRLSKPPQQSVNAHSLHQQ